jgi:hypothetical protein
MFQHVDATFPLCIIPLTPSSWDDETGP